MNPEPFDHAALMRAYRVMLLSRRYDIRCNELIAAGTEVPHFHSGIGQEALSVAPVVQLHQDDQLLYTHRGYAHLLAKGVPVEQLALDAFLKVGGTNNGLGGAMHVSRPDIGLPGREGVFGTKFGIAVGLALAAQLDRSRRVVLCYFGEAAGARGILYESLNMAVLWKLPIVYIGENNGWSYSSRTEWLYPQGRMSRVWRGFDIPVNEVDGNDVRCVHNAAAVAIERARMGGGPSVLEGLTYRLDAHHAHDTGGYRPDDEVARWRARDPLVLAREQLLEAGTEPSALEQMDDDAAGQVASALKAALGSRDANWSDSSTEVTAWQS